MADPKRVLCCGTFDHLHPGHEAFLRQAAALGDELYVVVARDENVVRFKGRPPEQGEEDRRRAVESLGLARQVRLGNPGADLLQVVAEIAPDIIALGYDQREPAGLRDAFPRCCIAVLEAHHPERYKSSLFRQQRGG
jgi:FAD synthetase